MDLPTALRAISTLEKQLEELESTSNEYELELEATVERLKVELQKAKDEKNSVQSSNVAANNITKLEIRIDELENENRALKSQVESLRRENDSILEENVLLQHEVNDMTELIHQTQVIPQKSIKEAPHGENIRVSSNGSSLRITSRHTADSSKITHLSSTTVLAKTNYK
ncbi:LAFE_0F09208g1_1 [Lachancea fermentati]|uniref:LAFE_0F09208g1_1 n=1 Tax=Lachancea fermentati TaxID=4955 RepID=A0A1G4MFJ8_LACFM|nr:LAFE_0F09208g1_1 [Lachancea fermentati]